MKREIFTSVTFNPRLEITGFRRTQHGPFFESPETFSHSESHGKTSNLQSCFCSFSSYKTVQVYTPLQIKIKYKFALRAGTVFGTFEKQVSRCLRSTTVAGSSS